MKKLTTLFILVFLSVGLFAEPKVTKVSSYENGINKYYYINDKGTNDYKIFSVVDYGEYYFYFINKSLITNVKIELKIVFNDEKTLDTFTKNINLTDIENEFTRIRKLLITSNISPSVFVNPITNTYSEIFYPGDVDKLKY